MEVGAWEQWWKKYFDHLLKLKLLISQCENILVQLKVLYSKTYISMEASM